MSKSLALNSKYLTDSNTLNFTKHDIILKYIDEIKAFIKDKNIDKCHVKYNTYLKDFILNNICKDKILNHNTSVFSVTNTRSQTYLYIIFYSLINNNYLEMDYKDFINFYKDFNINIDTYRTKKYFDEITNDSVKFTSSNNIFSKSHNSYNLDLIKKKVLELIPNQYSSKAKIEEIKNDLKEKKSYNANGTIRNIILGFKFHPLVQTLSIKKIEELFFSANKFKAEVFNFDIYDGLLFGFKEKLISKEILETLKYEQIQLLNINFFKLIKDGYYSFEQLIQHVDITSVLITNDCNRYLKESSNEDIITQIDKILSETHYIDLKQINPSLLESLSTSINKETIKEFVNNNQKNEKSYEKLRKALLLMQLKKIGNGNQIKIYLKKHSKFSYTDFTEIMEEFNKLIDQKKLLFYSLDYSLYNSSQDLINIYNQFSKHDINFLKLQFNQALSHLYIKKALDFLKIGELNLDSLKTLVELLRMDKTLEATLIKAANTFVKNNLKSLDFNDIIEKDVILERKNSISSLKTRDSIDSNDEIYFNDKLIRVIKETPQRLLSSEIKILIKKGVSLKYIVENLEEVEVKIPYLLNSTSLKLADDNNINLNELVKFDIEHLKIFTNQIFVNNISKIFNKELTLDILYDLQKLSIKNIKLFSSHQLDINYKAILSGYEIVEFFSLNKKQLKIIFSSYQINLYRYFTITAKEVMQDFEKHQVLSNCNGFEIIKCLSNNSSSSDKEFILKKLFFQDLDKIELLTSELAYKYISLYKTDIEKIISFSKKRLKLLFSEISVNIGKFYNENKINSHPFERIDEQCLQIFVEIPQSQRIFNLLIENKIPLSTLINLNFDKLLYLFTANGYDYIEKTQIYKEQKKFEDFCNFDKVKLAQLLNMNTAFYLNWGFDHDFLSSLSYERIKILTDSIFLNYLKDRKDNQLLDSVKELFNDKSNNMDDEMLRLITSKEAIQLYLADITSIPELIKMQKKRFMRFPKTLEEKKSKLRLMLGQINFDKILDKCKKDGKKLHSYSTIELKQIS